MFRFLYKLSLIYISIIEPNLFAMRQILSQKGPLSILTLFIQKTMFFLQFLSQKAQNHTSLGRLHQIGGGFWLTPKR